MSLRRGPDLDTSIHSAYREKETSLCLFFERVSKAYSFLFKYGHWRSLWPLLLAFYRRAHAKPVANQSSMYSSA